MKQGHIDKRILHLTLHRQWFELIASGEKLAEYRQAKPYWLKRLMLPDGLPRRFDEIHFRNGYGHDRPLVVTGFIATIKTHADLCYPLHGEQLEGLQLVIAIGKVLRIENYGG